MHLKSCPCLCGATRQLPYGLRAAFRVAALCRCGRQPLPRRWRAASYASSYHTIAMKTKKTVSKPTSWTYLERFCFSATPDDQEEKTGDPPVLELHANFELKVKHRGGSLLMYFSDGANSFPSIANKTFTELSLEERYAKATVAYDFLMVDGQETTSSKKSYLISRSPRFVYLVWSNYNTRCNEKCSSDYQNGTLSIAQQAQLISCDLEYKQRCMGPTEIEYDFHLWNGNEWAKEFSADEDAFCDFHPTVLPANTLSNCGVSRTVRLEAGGKKLHLTTRVLTRPWPSSGSPYY